MKPPRYKPSSSTGSGKIGGACQLIGGNPLQRRANRADKEAYDSRRNAEETNKRGGLQFDLQECEGCARTVAYYYQYKKGRHRNTEVHYAPCGLQCAYGFVPMYQFAASNGRLHKWGFYKGEKQPCSICGIVTEGLLNAFRQYWKRKTIVESIHDEEDR